MCGCVKRVRERQSWALPVFLNFFNNKKWFFAFFIKLIWLGVGILNRTDAKIGNLIKNAKKIIFYYWKNSKIPKVPSYAQRTRESVWRPACACVHMTAICAIRFVEYGLWTLFNYPFWGVSSSPFVVIYRRPNCFFTRIDNSHFSTTPPPPSERKKGVREGGVEAQSRQVTNL